MHDDEHDHDPGSHPDVPREPASATTARGGTAEPARRRPGRSAPHRPLRRHRRPGPATGPQPTASYGSQALGVLASGAGPTVLPTDPSHPDWADLMPPRVALEPERCDRTVRLVSGPLGRPLRAGRAVGPGRLAVVHTDVTCSVSAASVFPEIGDWTNGHGHLLGTPGPRAGASALPSPECLLVGVSEQPLNPLVWQSARELNIPVLPCADPLRERVGEVILGNLRAYLAIAGPNEGAFELHLRVTDWQRWWNTTMAPWLLDRVERRRPHQPGC